jgi:predicted lipoprotein with Yx(FWY)xxD motif
MGMRRRHTMNAPRLRGRGTRYVQVMTAVGVALGLGLAGAGVCAAATATVLVTTNATFGPVLTSGSGLALYTLTTDHNGQSTCHGSCAAVWPPLNVPAGTVPTAGAGVTGTVGTATQTNGTVQVTYNGSPLYTFVGDTSPGQVTGNGVSDFFVVKVAAASPPTTTPAPPPATPSGTNPSTTSSGPSSGTPAPASTGPAPATAPNAGSGVVPTVAPGTLAFTGTGPGFLMLLVLGAVLCLFGGLMVLRPLGREKGDSAPQIDNQT